MTGIIFISSPYGQMQKGKIDDSYEHFRSKQATIEIEEKYKLHQADKKEKSTQEDHNIKKIEIRKGNVKKQVASDILNIPNTFH